MATALKSEEFLIKEWEVQHGTWTSPETIGTDATDPRTKFSGTVLGYTKQGSENLDLAKEYAEFRSLTPGIVVRKDLVFKAFNFAAELGQFDGDSMSLLKNLNSQLAYGVTVPGAQTWDIMHVGSDEPVQAATGFLLSGALTNGDEFIIGIYAGRFLPEGDAIAPTGTEHAVQPFSVQSFVHPDFAGEVDEAQKHYGFIGIKTA